MSKKTSQAKSPSMLAFLKSKNGETVAVYPALGNRTRPAGEHNPEEKVRMNLYNELIATYSYPVDCIDIEFPVIIREDETPRYADIVVFSDKEKKRPLIVIEAKSPDKKVGEKQGQRYATILRAVYVLWSNGSDRSSSVIVNRYPEEAVPIPDIPKFGGTPKYEIKELSSFGDDKQMTDAVRKCHSLIRNHDNLKPDVAFNEFLKIMLVKFEDETKESQFDFQVLLKGAPPQPEPSNETAQRIRLLFKFAVEHEAEVSTIFNKEEDIALSNDCIVQIVLILQRYSFSSTTIDHKGRAFETFITGDMRQEFKEFMTPRPVIEAVVEIANPTTTMAILDPCCGSGAFLTYSLEHVRKVIERKSIGARQKVKAVFDFAHDRLWGFDASTQMAAVARMNMLVNEDGRAHIFSHNALLPREKSPLQVQPKYFDLILTNPPFGKRITKSSTLLELFQVTRDKNGRIKKGDAITEILFLERNLEWLKAGGRMFIVLPDSVLGNSTLSDQRSFIESKAKLVGVISLSPDTFGPSGAKSKTSVVILEKRHDDRDNAGETNDQPVFVSHVADVGYDFTGRATNQSRLQLLIADFKQYESGKIDGFSISRVIPRQVLGDNWLAQPHLGEKKKIHAQQAHWTLGQICATIQTGKTAPRSFYRPNGHHMIKVGNLTGRGIEWNAVERQYVDKEFVEKNISAALKMGDILFTAAAHGPKWIGLKVDIYEGPPAGIAEPVIACGEIMICRLRDEEEIDPYYILLFLRSSAGYEAIQKCIRGQSGHVYSNEVSQIVIPIPDARKKKKTQEAVETLKKSLFSRRQASEFNILTSNLSQELFPSTVQKPIIAT